MCYLLRMRSGCCLLLVASLCAFITAPIPAQEKAEQPTQGFTGYPPSVYMRPFLACVSDAPCAQTDEFHLDQVPTGCCVLIVTNGDGQGTDEVRSYEVFLNGERVVPTDHSRSAQAAVKLRATNTLKVVLSGAPHSKVFVLFAYDPRAQEKSTLPQDSQPFLKSCTVKNPQPCADKPPRFTYAPAPECSKEARKKKIDSTVVLEIVVGTDGLVNDISVVQPLGYGLEEAATKAVKTWRFKPGTSLGNPAPVQMRVEVEFRCQLMS